MKRNGMNYKALNNITGWIVFAIATIVYIMTIEPTTSLWDCGEYITTAARMEVGHPPGAPLFMMIGRLFASLASPEGQAAMVNAMSGVCSSFTILFLFWSITMLARKMAPDYHKLSTGDTIAILSSGAIGALAYTFTDSFWFSAVEGEVYAMSSFFTAIVFWAILKWETVAHEPHADRWLILIFYLIGLSIGVHLLNLLAIPAICFVYYFKRYETNTKSFLITSVLSILILGVVQGILIPKTVALAAWFETMFVNSLGTGFNVGTFVFITLLIGLIAFGVRYSRKAKKPMLNTIIVSFGVLLIGYSSFSMIVIRSNANTPLDENNPETMASLYSYLQREQYGSWPILYGPYWNSPVIGYDDKKPTLIQAYVLQKGGKDLKRGRQEMSFATYHEAKKYQEANHPDAEIAPKYVVSDNGKEGEPKYAPAYNTYFPRMYRQGEGIKYMQWSGYEGDQSRPLPFPGNDPNIRDMAHYHQLLIQNGQYEEAQRVEQQGLYKPRFGENISYMVNYQFGWMYWRYFLWNFSGRQNELQGYGLVGSPNGRYLEGNWISGVPIIDKYRLGPQKNLPHKVVDSKGYNRYFMLPLILGLIGMIFHLARKPKDWFVVLLLFLFTGLAIVFYLNQKPAEPRERDYAYAASFYAFSIWIGLGVWALYDMAKNLDWKKYGIAFGATVGFGLFSFIVNRAFGMSVLYMGIVSFTLIGLLMLLRSVGSKGLAIASLLIATPIPVILAVQNWDDHDRSGRESARDIARNYLDSCDENAILFTHGDNDTFPLWYVQEVEGHRTDVRVVNLSLLGTDWHVNQSKRKAWKSEPVPFTADEHLYRQGTRDVIYHFDPKKEESKTAVPAIDVYNYIMSDQSLQRIPNSLRKRPEYTYRNRQIWIPVDKENAIKSGIADTNIIKLPIENRLEWSISGAMIKSDLMVLDLLAHYDWKRPIYFAGDAAAHSGLRKYFQLEGLTYKLTPFNISSGVDKDGKRYTFNPVKTMMRLTGEGAETEEEVKKIFQWGNMNQKGVFVDYYTMRMVYNLRMQFWKFSSELIENGQNEEAIAVLDKCFEIMPIWNVAPDDITYYMAGNYYDAGAKEKGDAIGAQLRDMRLDDMHYFMDLDLKWKEKMLQEMGRSLMHLELLRQASIPSDKFGRPLDQNDQGIMAGTTYDQDVVTIGTDLYQMIRKTKGSKNKQALLEKIQNPRLFPPRLLNMWFSAPE